MKRILYFVSIVILLVCISCQSISTNKLDGTWGLIHRESVTKQDGAVIIPKEVIDLNPLNPVGDNDEKWVFSNTTKNNYLITRYSWSRTTSAWVHPDNLTASIKGNKLYLNGFEWTFSIAGDRLTLSANQSYNHTITEVTASGISDRNVIWVSESTYVFRKMSALSE